MSTPNPSDINLTPKSVLKSPKSSTIKPRSSKVVNFHKPSHWKDSQIKIIDFKFDYEAIFNIINTISGDIGHCCRNGFILSERIWKGIKRRGHDYLDDILRENPQWKLTDEQRHYIYDFFVYNDRFSSYDDILHFQEREAISQGKQMPQELKGDLRAYEPVSREEEEAERKQRHDQQQQKYIDELRKQSGSKETFQEVGTSYKCKRDGNKVIAFLTLDKGYVGICPVCKSTYQLGRGDIGIKP